MEVDLNLVQDFTNLNRESPEFTKKCTNLATELENQNLTIVQLVELLGPLLIDKFSDKRELGLWVLTTVLGKLPQSQLDDKQLQFICNFYTDRLKDHHQVIPAVLEGFRALTKFDAFPKDGASAFLTALFQNISCQQQRENDRLTIYEIFETLLRKNQSELCLMGLDFVYGVISAVDGERNPKNLIFLFNWFPVFFQTVQLGHLAEEAFEAVACYFPVDFKAPSSEAFITRDHLANLLAPCLTAIPDFAEFCFTLALEKFDSSLEVAKLDSLKLIELGCVNFKTENYLQHITEIWSQIQLELFNQPTPEIEKFCLKTLTSVLRKISTEPKLSSTVRDILDTVKMNLLPDSKLFQPSIKLLLSVAEASQVSCKLVTIEVAPILLNLFNLNTTHRGVILRHLVDFYYIYANFFDVIEIEDLKKIPYLCLTCAQNDMQIVALSGLKKIANFLPQLLRVEIYDKLFLNDRALECFEELARIYPDEIKARLGLEISDERVFEQYAKLLSVLITQDFFTQLILDLLLSYFQSNRFEIIIISTLRHIVERNEKINEALLERNLIGCLVDWSLKQKTNEDVSFLLSSLVRIAPNQKAVIENELPKLTNHDSFLLYGLLSHLRQEVVLDYKILDQLRPASLGDEKAAQLLANLLNKAPDEVIHSFVEKHKYEENLNLVVWTAKALLTRSHPLAEILLNRFLERDDQVARSFKILLNDKFNCLSGESYSVRALLYQQKYFTIITTRLAANPNRAFLLAFGYLLEATPRNIILLQFPKILKLIILCLDECQEIDILITILEMIKDFITKKEKCFDEHLSDFLARFLKLTTFETSMKVRVAALQCLQECVNSCPVYKLVPHKLEVLNVLGKVLDDRKRIVRREAVEARSLWFILDYEN